MTLWELLVSWIQNRFFKRHGKIPAQSTVVISESERVEAEVRLRQQQARSRGLDQALCDLVNRYAICESPSHGALPKSWKSAKVVDLTKYKNSLKAVELQSIAGLWTIVATQGQYVEEADTFYSHLKLFVEQQEVLDVSDAIDSADLSDWGKYPSPCGVNVYRPGDWEASLLALRNELTTDEAVRKKQAKENPTRLLQLKERFGL